MSEDKERNFSTDYEIQELRAERDSLKAELAARCSCGHEPYSGPCKTIAELDLRLARLEEERDELKAKLAEVEKVSAERLSSLTLFQRIIDDQSATIEKMRAALLLIGRCDCGNNGRSCSTDCRSSIAKAALEEHPNV